MPDSNPPLRSISIVLAAATTTAFEGALRLPARSMAATVYEYAVPGVAVLSRNPGPSQKLSKAPSR